MTVINYIGRLTSKNSKFLLLLPTIILISIILIPDFAFIGTEAIIITLILWLLTIITKTGQLDRKSRNVIIAALLYFLVVFLYKIIGVSQATWEIAAGYFGYLFAIVVSLITIQICNDKHLKAIEYTFYIVTILGILYVTQQGNYNLRVMDVEEAISQENAAYSSLIMLFSGICFIAILNYKNRRYKYLYIIALILSINVNFAILQRGTNVIFTGLMILGILYFRKVNQHNVYKRVILIGIILGAIYYTGAIVPILEYVIDIIPSERVASRLESIVIYFETKDIIEAGTSFTSRAQLAEQSIRTFLGSIQNFFLGVGDDRSFDSIIGNHSEIIDASARYGIIGLLLIINVFYTQFKFIKNITTSDTAIRYQVLVVFFMYFFRNINGNTMTSPVAFLLFMYLPIIVYFTKKETL